MSTHTSHPPSRPISLSDKGLRCKADMLVELGWLIFGPYVWDISWENADWAPFSLLSLTFLVVNLGLLIAWQTQVSQTYPSLLKAPGVGIPRGLGGSCKPA